MTGQGHLQTCCLLKRTYNANGNLVGNISTNLGGNAASVNAGAGAPTLSNHVSLANGAAVDISVAANHKSVLATWNNVGDNYVFGLSGCTCDG